MTAHNSLYRLGLFPAALIALAIGYAEEPHTAPPTRDEVRGAICKEWRGFSYLDLTTSKPIPSARLVMQKERFFSSKDNEVTVDVTIDDGDELAIVAAAIADVLVELPVEDNHWPPVSRIGYLTFPTKNGEARIVIYENEFGPLITEEAWLSGDSGHFFHSPSLTTLLDALLIRERGHGFPEKQREHMSREFLLDYSVRNAKVASERIAQRIAGKLVNRAGQELPLDEAAQVPPRDEWALWDVLDGRSSPKQARLVMGNGKKRDLDVVFTDRDALDFLLPSGMITSPPRSTDKPPDSKPIGRIDITLTSGLVQIEIHPECFRLVTVPKELLGPSKVFLFQCPGAAYFIDAIRASVGVPRFSDEQREALSGEAYIKAKRAEMLELIAKTPSLRREEASPQESTK